MPDSNYTHSMDCWFYIVNSYNYGTIRMYFEQFETEKNYDFVYVSYNILCWFFLCHFNKQIHDGPNSNGTLIGNFTGILSSFWVYSSTNSLSINFRTDGTTEAAGFRARYFFGINLFSYCYYQYSFFSCVDLCNPRYRNVCKNRECSATTQMFICGNCLAGFSPVSNSNTCEGVFLSTSLLNFI